MHPSESISLIKRILFLILIFSNVSASVFNKYSGVSEDVSTSSEDLSRESHENVISSKRKIVKNIDIRKVEKHIKNNIAARGHPSRNKDVNEYTHTALVKRIVPHGYKINSLEYDDKFNTLYKPLVRVHKKKSNLDSTHNDKGKNIYDLMYLLDDNNKDIINEGKDDALFKPFAIDNMNIEYLPDYRSAETYGKRDEKYTKNNNVNLFQLGDRKLQLNNQNIPIPNELADNENGNSHETVDTLENFDEPLKSWNIDNANTNSGINELLNEIGQKSYERSRSKGNVKTYTSAPLKLQWFGTFGQLLSKHFINLDQKKNKVKRDYQSTERKKLITLLKDILQKDIKDKKEKETKKYVRHLWFVPMGQLTSKQLNRKESLYGQFERSPEDKKINTKLSDSYSRPHSLSKKELDTEELDPVKHLRPIRNKPRHYNKKYDGVKKSDLSKWFGPIGGLVPKQKEVDIQTTSDKYTLLKQLTQLRAENIQKKIKEREKIREILRNLKFSRMKSGEDPDADAMPQSFWVAEESTTLRPTSVLPRYPFWNYWTYDKTIHQDLCKGQTVQYGNICIGIPH